MDAAAAGRGHVFFVDAADFVFGTFLCCLWSIARLFVRAASGRQRFNVLGAWNAVTRELLAITNTTVVNGETMDTVATVVTGFRIGASTVKGFERPARLAARCSRFMSRASRCSMCPLVLTL